MDCHDYYQVLHNTIAQQSLKSVEWFILDKFYVKFYIVYRMNDNSLSQKQVGSYQYSLCDSGH